MGDVPNLQLLLTSTDDQVDVDQFVLDELDIRDENGRALPWRLHRYGQTDHGPMICITIETGSAAGGAIEMKGKISYKGAQHEMSARYAPCPENITIRKLNRFNITWSL